MSTNEKFHSLDKDISNLAMISNGYISEGVTFEDLTNGYWFDQEVESIVGRYPDDNLDKDDIKNQISNQIKELMNRHLYD